uniref:Putative secreted protein n=1 Tax=Anopheles darlingi TaxID=43151 RepID=A0A2M4DAB9_ANODA
MLSSRSFSLSLSHTLPRSLISCSCGSSGSSSADCYRRIDPSTATDPLPGAAGTGRPGSSGRCAGTPSVAST